MRYYFFISLGYPMDENVAVLSRLHGLFALGGLGEEKLINGLV